MDGAVIIGRLESDDDVAVVGPRQSSLCYGRPGDISAETLKLFTLMRFTGDTGMP